METVVGISRNSVNPLVKSGSGERIPFGDDEFNFVFSGEGSFTRSVKPAIFAAEISWRMKHVESLQ